MAEDNRDLMKFLEKQFEGIYKRLDNTDKKLENAASKDDLANFATKDDLANFATKDDLVNFATKDDLVKFATKYDIEEVKRHTGILIEAIDHKIDIVIEGVMAVNERLDRRTDENEQEHRRLEKMSLINTADISKLEQRVIRLEGKV